MREKERREKIAAQRKEEFRKQLIDALLFIGILIIPYIFSWFTLQKRYSTTWKVMSFGWLGLMLRVAFNGNSD
ncbi:hypothetical protein D5125_07585 [Magnetovirga frankeli]|uniref:hypothetical protein n=1 Tax=Magnetovirga frankeli TaxID=947516 RepID=UPI00129318D5|nr:hypothetical protein D5125_07585 [gamma proteobacterium SS-5]